MGRRNEALTPVVRALAYLGDAPARLSSLKTVVHPPEDQSASKPSSQWDTPIPASNGQRRKRAKCIKTSNHRTS